MIVLIIALILAVLAAASYQLTVETESSKLQEESVRALAAADSGIEFGLRKANTESGTFYTFQGLGLAPEGIDLVKSTITIVTNPPVAVNPITFASQKIEADEQLTFYTSNYPDMTGGYSQPLDIYFDEDSTSACGSTRTKPALEISYVYGADGENVGRQVVDPCSSGSRIAGNNLTPVDSTSFNIDSYTFNYKLRTPVNTSAYPNLKYILVRVFYGPTRIGFVGNNLPSQGKTIRSEAHSISGASKIVQVYQSYPQIPADFFVTTF